MYFREYEDQYWVSKSLAIRKGGRKSKVWF